MISVLPQPRHCLRRLVAAFLASGVTSLPALAADHEASLVCEDPDVNCPQLAAAPAEKPDEERLPVELQDLLAPPLSPLADAHDQPVVPAVPVLRPLTLADARALARANNPALQAVRLRIQAAEAKLRSSLALWYPSADLDSNTGFPVWIRGRRQTRLLSPDPLLPGSSASLTADRDDTQATISLYIRWNLIDPKRVPRIAADRDALELAKMDDRIQRRELDLQIAEAYYSLQLADEELKVAEGSVKTSRSTLNNSRIRYEAGVVTRNNLLAAEAQLAADEASQALAEAEQATARRRLARILNLPHHVTPVAKESHRPRGVWTATLEESLAAAVATREELQQFAFRISENRSRAQAALGDTEPMLYLFNLLNWSRVEGTNQYQPSNTREKVTAGWYNALGLGLDWRFYDGGEAKASARRLRLQAEREAWLLADARNTFRSEVEAEFYNLQAQKTSLRSRKLQVRASRDALRITSLRYEAGVGIQQDVIDRQRDFTGAGLAHARSVAEYNRSLARLYRYTGLPALEPCDQDKRAAVSADDPCVMGLPAPEGEQGQ